MYDWVSSDPDMYLFSCRDIRPMPGFDTWLEKKKKDQSDEQVVLKALVWEDEPATCLGRFKAFDYNRRNGNFEVGYYFPPSNRGLGYGSAGFALFISLLASYPLPVRTLIATTSELNEASQKLLVKHGFQLSGVLPQHFEIRGQYFDQHIYSFCCIRE